MSYVDLPLTAPESPNEQPAETVSARPPSAGSPTPPQILRRVAPRVGFVALIGLTAALLCDGGDAVWWQIPWSWKLYQAGYDFSFWLIAGLILARFVEAKRA